MKTIAYIAHPIGGDVESNIEKVIKIVLRINLGELDTVPFCPYIGDVTALYDDDPQMRKRGMDNNKEYFKRKVMDEVRLYGSFISKGMKDEIFWALDNDIKVRPMTVETRKQYWQILKSNEYNKYLIRDAEQAEIETILKGKDKACLVSTKNKQT